MRCPTCLKEVSNDSSFCNYCGGEINKIHQLSESEIQYIVETETTKQKNINTVNNTAILAIVFSIINIATFAFFYNLTGIIAYNLIARYNKLIKIEKYKDNKMDIYRIFIIISSIIICIYWSLWFYYAFIAYKSTLPNIEHGFLGLIKWVSVFARKLLILP